MQQLRILRAMSTAASTAAGAAVEAAKPTGLVMQIILRRDLVTVSCAVFGKLTG